MQGVKYIVVGLCLHTPNIEFHPRLVPLPFENPFPFLRFFTKNPKICPSFLWKTYYEIQFSLLELQVFEFTKSYCYCICRTWSKKLGQYPILVKNSTFFKKSVQNNSPPRIQSQFLSILNQNKTLHNFHQSGQH